MKNIQHLLEKFWKAESSLEEEKEIKDFFTASENQDFEDQLFFESLRQESQIKSKLDEDSFLKLIKKEEQPAKVFSLRPLLKYAAILMLPIAMVFSFKMLKMSDSQSGLAAIETSDKVLDINNPEDAYEITMEALMYASSKMKKAENEVKSKLPLLDKTRILK